MPTFAEIRKQLREELARTTPGDPLAGLDINYALAKSSDEKRYTLGVLYVPQALDADDEYADADDLQAGIWNYVRKGRRDIRDTHTQVQIGELVEIVSWPFAQEMDARTGDGEVRKFKMPPNTVYAGVVWSPEAWELVKTGKLRGYSLGGRAIRMKEASSDAEMPRMEDLGVLAAETTQAVGKTQPIAKDAPQPITVNDRVAWANDDLSLGMRGRVLKVYGRPDDGVVVHDVRWDNGTETAAVPGFSLRNLAVT